MLLTIALIGQPNVGKSTLFNQLTCARDALVVDYPGLTRDRQYGQGKLGDFPYLLIDTAGIDQAAKKVKQGKQQADESVESINQKMIAQSILAIEEAQIIFFIVDAQQTVNVIDQMLAKMLRQQEKTVYLILNKMDGMNPDFANAEYSSLALGCPYPIVATQGKGIKKLMHAVFTEHQHIIDEHENEEEPSSAMNAMKVAIVGRPNVGKSTLINRILNEDRLMASHIAGTTRDSIYVPHEKSGEHYILIDTAGLRRKSHVTETVEKFSALKTLQSIVRAHVVILMLDAVEGIVDQDLHILGYALDAGKSIVLVMNKWDCIDGEHRQGVKKELDRRVGFFPFIEQHFVSAKTGKGIQLLYDSVKKAYDSSMKSWSANQLTQLLNHIVHKHPPHMVNGRRIKLRYCHMGGVNPPTLIIHGNQTSKIPDAYTRYLENAYRSTLKLTGTPIRICFRTGDNPFANKKNVLTERQIKKRKRLLRYVKT